MKVILFDLDGTLTDSAPGITSCVQYALEKMGKPEEDKSKLCSFVGPPLKEQFMNYAGFSQEEAVKAVEYYRERYTETGMYENAVYPGIEELLAYLKGKGCVLAVASSKPEVFVRQILEHFHLTGYFQEIVGAGLDEKRTTKAEVIEEALKRLRMSSCRQDVVMVGDRSYDILGAHECGIQCVGVAYGYGSMEELIKAGVTYVADTVEELEILAENDSEEPSVEISSIDVTELSREQEKQKKKEEKKKKRRKETEAPEYPIHESVIRKFWRIIYPALIYLGISVLVSVAATMAIMFIGMFVLGISNPQDLADISMQQVIAITGLSALVAIPIMALLMRRDERRRVSGAYEIHKAPEKKVTFKIILGTMFMGVGLCQVLNDLITLSGLNEIFPHYAQMEAQVYEGNSIWMVLLVVAVIAPVAEELVFRGLVMMRIRDYMGPVAGILLSALGFGLYHGNMVQFIYAGIIGIFLGYTMEKSQSVLVPIIGHMMANLWSVVGMSVTVVLPGRSEMTGIIIDLVMALLFLIGLALVGLSGKKVKKAEPETEDEEKNTVETAAVKKPEAESSQVQKADDGREKAEKKAENPSVSEPVTTAMPEPVTTAAPEPVETAQTEETKDEAKEEIKEES